MAVTPTSSSPSPATNKEEEIFDVNENGEEQENDEEEALLTGEETSSASDETISYRKDAVGSVTRRSLMCLLAAGIVIVVAILVRKLSSTKQQNGPIANNLNDSSSGNNNLLAPPPTVAPSTADPSPQPTIQTTTATPTGSNTATANNSSGHTEEFHYDIFPASAYQNPNDEPYEPPAWMREYIDFHRSQISSDGTLVSPDTRWIQWYCAYDTKHNDGSRHCGGLGDRLKGMLQSLLFAVISRRVSLLEEWESPPHPLKNYLEPNLIDWSAQPVNNDDDAKHDTGEVYAYLAKPKKTRIYTAIHDHPCEFNKPKYGTNHTGLRYTGNYFTKQSVIQHEPCILDLWPERDPNVELTMFWTLFRFSAYIREHADLLRGPIQTRNYYVAAHIRTGNGATWDDPLRHSTTEEWDTFAFCIKVIQDAMEERCGSGYRPLAYLASDNQEAKDYVQSKLPAGAVHSPEVEIMHIDRTHSTAMENATAAYDAVLGEFKILLDATCLIASDSGFSWLALSLSRLQPRCGLRHYECADPDKVREAVQNVQCPQ